MIESAKKRIADYTMQLYSCNSYAALVNIVKENEDLDNPYLYQAAGQWCLLKNYYETALPYFKKAILYGCNFPNKIWNTQMADSVGSSISWILTSYKTNYVEKPITNLFIMGYCYLTNCINLLGDSAFESLSNRASLMIDVSGTIKPENIPMFHLPQVYAISDIYKSALGLNKHGFTTEAQEKFAYAVNLHEWLEDISVAGKDADDYTINEIVEIGDSRHQHLFKLFQNKLLNNEYLINELELNQIFDSLSEK